MFLMRSFLPLAICIVLLNSCNFPLRPTTFVSISGVVSFPDGTPIQDAVVTFAREGDKDFQQTITNDQGIYRIDRIEGFQSLTDGQGTSEWLTVEANDSLTIFNKLIEVRLEDLNRDIMLGKKLLPIRDIRAVEEMIETPTGPEKWVALLVGFSTDDLLLGERWDMIYSAGINARFVAADTAKVSVYIIPSDYAWSGGTDGGLSPSIIKQTLTPEKTSILEPIKI